MTDISTDAYLARLSIIEGMAILSAPHVRMKPSIFADGDQWCCLYGENLMAGVAGFGETPELACMAFDKAWSTQRTARAERPKP
jgi:hypothetical protein